MRFAIANPLTAKGRLWPAADRARAALGPLVVLALVAMAMGNGLCACSMQERDDRQASTLSGAALVSHRTTAAPARAATTTNHAESARHAAASELGPETAASMPAVATSPPPEPVDPGAAMIVRSIDKALGGRAVNDQGVTVISTDEVRNLSRCGSGEFGTFKQRFAGLLSKAGREAKIEFIDEGASASAAHYRMQGTAYLVTADGFDQWELYLSVTPADRDFSVWDARNAIRVLRTARPGQPQITYIGR